MPDIFCVSIKVGGWGLPRLLSFDTVWGATPTSRETDIRRQRRMSVSCICIYKCPACQVAHPRKIPYPHSFVLWQTAVWQERFCGDPGWAYRRRTVRRPQAGVVLVATLGQRHHFHFVGEDVGGVLHKIAGNGRGSVAPGSLCHAGRIAKIKQRGRNQAA